MIYIITLITFFFTFFLIKIFYNNSDNKDFYLTKKNVLKNKNIKKIGIKEIDHIYILTLKSNKYKRERVVKMIENNFNIKLNYDNIFYGLYAKNLINTKKELIEQGFIDYHYNYYFPLKPFYFSIWRAPGCLGHNVSFYQIFRNAVFNNLEYFMIVEDDSVFKSNFIDYIDEYTELLKKDFDFISLGQSKCFYNNNEELLKSNKFVSNKLGIKVFKIEDSISLFQQTHTMIFKTKNLKNILKDYFPMKCPTDVMLGNFSRNFKTDIRNSLLKQESKNQKKLNGLFCYPPISKQKEDNKSDIEHWSIF